MLSFELIRLWNYYVSPLTPTFFWRIIDIVWLLNHANSIRLWTGEMYSINMKETEFVGPAWSLYLSGALKENPSF